MKAIRLTFSPAELRGIFALLGGEIGRIRDGNAINDGRPSEINKQVADLRLTQDRIEEALRKLETEEPKPETKPAIPETKPLIVETGQ